jgi:hypothetical protein
MSRDPHRPHFRCLGVRSESGCCKDFPGIAPAKKALRLFLGRRRRRSFRWRGDRLCQRWPTISHFAFIRVKSARYFVKFDKIWLFIELSDSFQHGSTSPKVTWVRLCAWQQDRWSGCGRAQPRRPRFQLASSQTGANHPACKVLGFSVRPPGRRGCPFGLGSDRNKSFRPRIVVQPTWVDLEPSRRSLKPGRFFNRWFKPGLVHLNCSPNTISAAARAPSDRTSDQLWPSAGRWR